MSETIRPLLIELPIAIKTYDIDYARIVHNRVYIRWLEDMRTELLAGNGYPIEEMLAEGLTPLLRRTEISYLQPLRFGDRPLGRMWVSDLGRTRWTVTGEIVLGGERTTESRQTGYFADMETGRPVRVPPRLHALWLDAQR